MPRSPQTAGAHGSKPHLHVAVDGGRVIERRPDPELKILDPISHKYVGKPFPMRGPEGRVALIVEVDKERYMKLPFQRTPPK